MTVKSTWTISPLSSFFSSFQSGELRVRQAAVSNSSPSFLYSLSWETDKMLKRDKVWISSGDWKLTPDSLFCKLSAGQCLKTYIQLFCSCTLFLFIGQKPQKGLKHPSRDHRGALSVFVFRYFWETLASCAKFRCHNKTGSSWGVLMKSYVKVPKFKENPILWHLWGDIMPAVLWEHHWDEVSWNWGLTTV